MMILEIEGQRVEVDDTFMQMSPEEQAAQVDEIARQMVIRPAQAQPQAQAAAPAQPESDGSGLGSFAHGVGAGATLNFGDELGGIMGGIIEGLGGPEGFMKAYKRNRNNIRATIDEAEKANPGLFLAGEFTGGAATALVPGGAVARGASLGSKIARGAAAGAGFGAGAGAGAAEELEDVPLAAGTGAATGAAIGGAFVPVASTAGKLVGGAVNKFKKRGLAKDLGVSRGALNRVSRAAKDDLAVNPRMARDLADEDMLLNAGDNLTGQASALARTPGEASGLISKAVDQQAAGEGQRVSSAINKILGPDKGRVNNRKLLKEEQKAAGKLFDIARKQGKNHSLRGIDKEVMGVMDTGEGVIGDAFNKISKMKVFNNVDRNGNVTGSATTVQIHNARKALDDMLEKKVGDTALQSNARMAVQAVRREIDDILKSEVPGWRQADQTFSTVKQKQTAFADGADALKSNLSPDEVSEIVGNMKPEVADLYRRGMRDSISRIMGTARNDAGAAARELSEKNWNDQKIAAIVGKGPAKQLNNFLTKAKSRQNAKNTITGNSVTARAQAAQKEFPNPANRGEVIDDVGKGGFTGMATRGAMKAANMVAGGALDRRANKLNSQAANLLTKRGPEARALLGQLTSNQAGKASRLTVEQALNAGLLGGVIPQGQPLFAGTVRPINPNR